MDSDIRAYLLNKNGDDPRACRPPLSVGPNPGRQAPARSSDRPVRDVLVEGYYSLSYTKLWAWEGLRRLQKTLEARQEPSPDLGQVGLGDEQRATAAPRHRREHDAIGPQGQKRPADTNACAVQVCRIATGEIEEDVPTAQQAAKMQPMVASTAMLAPKP